MCFAGEAALQRFFGRLDEHACGMVEGQLPWPVVHPLLERVPSCCAKDHPLRDLGAEQRELGVKVGPDQCLRPGTNEQKQQGIAESKYNENCASNATSRDMRGTVSRHHLRILGQCHE
jgi:hypothetical protein